MNELIFLYNSNRIQMAGGGSTRDIVLGVVAVGAVLLAVYMVDPTLGGLMRSKDGFCL